jgi:outer membrane lipoprotein SlyB
MTASKFIFIVPVLFTFMVGCAAKRPVLYPNATLKQAGNAAAQAEIDACLRMADESGVASGKGEEAAKRTAGAAAIGAASGAAWGAFFGDAGKRAGAGAAAGAAGALVHGALTSNEPDVVYRGFVERCLREKGYDVIGWK